MYTIDRLNVLRDHYGLSPLKAERLWRTTDPNTQKLVNRYPCHHFLNLLDSKANLDTRGYGGATVGERLTMHEFYIRGGKIMTSHQKRQTQAKTSPPKYYHWLGAAA